MELLILLNFKTQPPLRLMRLMVRHVAQTDHPTFIELEQTLKFSRVQVFLVCFSFSDENSFLNVQNWANETKEASPQATIVLLGLQSDVSDYNDDVFDGEELRDMINARIYRKFSHNDNPMKLLGEITHARENDFDEELVTPGTERIETSKWEDEETKSTEEKKSVRPYAERNLGLIGCKNRKPTASAKLRDFHKAVGIAVDFQKLFGSTKLSDCKVVIRTEDGMDEYKLPCHRVVLAARSPVLKSMLYPNDGNKDFEVVLEGVYNKNVLEQFVKYLYTDTLWEHFDQEVREGLVLLADRYKIGSLKIACGLFARENTTEQNWLEIYNFAKSYREEALCSQALEIPAAILPELYENKTFLALPFDIMDDLLGRDDLCLNEKFLLKMVCEWGEEPGRTEQVKLLLKKIRYPLMGAKTLVDEIKGNPLVPHEDYISALEYFACPRLFKDVLKTNPKYRTRRGACQFGWDNTGMTNILITNFDKTIRKTGVNQWDCMVLSDASMSSGLQYWQIKIDVLNGDKSGLALGFTSDRNLGYSSYNACCSLSMSGGAYFCTAAPNTPSINQGDIIGFVVDFQNDESKIYQNGRLIQTGTQKPSTLGEVWAVAFLYYSDDQISLVDDINLNELID
ncbi:kelch-like protein [Acrasis kona]|uniref:Kelch-like protein n=1 Tax=Acrasis kona TaxID=1008807 RepID=A0AAW2YP44_9EUKA